MSYAYLFKYIIIGDTGKYEFCGYCFRVIEAAICALKYEILRFYSIRRRCDAAIQDGGAPT